MERLPDFLILDFCEWLKRSFLRRKRYSVIDMWDLLFDEEYNELLLEKAEEFCNRKNNSCSKDNIKRNICEIIGLYYESDEFRDLCYRMRECKGYYSQTYLLDEFQKSFDFFRNSLCEKVPGFYRKIYDCDRQQLSPYDLVDSLRCCYRDSLREKQVKKPFLQFMMAGRSIEIEFLEWVEQENLEKEIIGKIDLMPVTVFEEYVRRFCKDTGNKSAAGRKIVNSFKKSE